MLWNMRYSAGSDENGKIERFDKTIKREPVSRTSCFSIQRTRDQMNHYNDQYNNLRLNSVILSLTPKDVLLGKGE